LQGALLLSVAQMFMRERNHRQARGAPKFARFWNEGGQGAPTLAQDPMRRLPAVAFGEGGLYPPDLSFGWQATIPRSITYRTDLFGPVNNREQDDVARHAGEVA
jgi:hypothetical protein